MYTLWKCSRGNEKDLYLSPGSKIITTWLKKISLTFLSFSCLKKIITELSFKCCFPNYLSQTLEIKLMHIIECYYLLRFEKEKVVKSSVTNTEFSVSLHRCNLELQYSFYIFEYYCLEVPEELCLLFGHSLFSFGNPVNMPFLFEKEIAGMFQEMLKFLCLMNFLISRKSQEHKRWIHTINECMYFTSAQSL